MLHRCRQECPLIVYVLGHTAGSVLSLLNPLTNRLKSPNTSLRSSGRAPVPVEGPLDGGLPSAANKLSAAPMGVLTPSTSGSEIRLPVGLVAFEAPLLIWVVFEGSMSSEDRKEVVSSSFLVLVMVKNESRRLFCSSLGVPFRSRICTTL